MSIEGLHLGARRDDDAPLVLPPAALLRHAMALGASGSGKTVFCKAVVEEVLRAGVPALCVDPQGDLCSLLEAGDPEAWRAHGVDEEAARAFLERVDPVIWTPASQKGVPLSVDPVDPGLAELPADERLRAQSRTAARIVGLLGWDLDADEGVGLAAVFDRALGDRMAAGVAPRFEDLDAQLEAGAEAYAQLVGKGSIEAARRRLARLDVGARRLLFHEGVPLDVPRMLGLHAEAPPHKTRLSVVYLNTLDAQEDKDFLLASLVDRLYAWMLRHPSSELQALFYVDEVAPFLPPVRKPACKEGLQLLFKQARKYGVGCLMATQNPGDVDYKAMAQFGTWALGRVTTRQDRQKLRPTVQGLAPDDADALLDGLPGQAAGELTLLCPDHLEAPTPMRVRWLYGRHETWSEARIEEAAAAFRAREMEAAGLRGEALGGAAQSEEAPGGEAPGGKAPDGAVEPGAAPARSSRGEGPIPGAHGHGADGEPRVAEVDAESASGVEGAAPIPAAALSEAAEEPEPGSASLETAPTSGGGLRARIEALLVERASASVAELAEALGASKSGVRAAATAAVGEGALRRFEGQGGARFWHPGSGARPDLGLERKVFALALGVSLEDAQAHGEAACRGKAFGVLGEAERFDHAELAYRLLYKLDFEERLPPPLLERLFGGGAAEDEHLGSLYFHPQTLELVTYAPSRGVRFGAPTEGAASAVRDFDGQAEIVTEAPAELPLVEEDLRERRRLGELQAHFEERWEARPTAVSFLFVPVWTLVLRRGKGQSFRRVTLDGLVGRPLRWP